MQQVESDWNILRNVSFNDVLDGNGTIENFDVARLAKEVEEKRKYKYQTEGEIIVSVCSLPWDNILPIFIPEAYT